MKQEFEQILLIAKPEKIEKLRAYCNKNGYGCYEIVENMPMKEVRVFEQFLADNLICGDKSSFIVPVPTKNKIMLQELQEYADRNGFEITIEGTEAMIIDIPNIIADSSEFEELLMKLELEFEKEIK